MSIKFYDVKTRQSVELPESAVSKTKYTNTTAAGKQVERHAFRGDYEGRKLTKFVSQSDYDAFNGPEV